MLKKYKIEPFSKFRQILTNATEMEKSKKQSISKTPISKQFSKQTLKKTSRRYIKKTPQIAISRFFLDSLCLIICSTNVDAANANIEITKSKFYNETVKCFEWKNWEKIMKKNMNHFWTKSHGNSGFFLKNKRYFKINECTNSNEKQKKSSNI